MWEVSWLHPPHPLGLRVSFLFSLLLGDLFCGFVFFLFSEGHGWPMLCLWGLRSSEPRGWLLVFGCVSFLFSFFLVIRYIVLHSDFEHYVVHG